LGLMYRFRLALHIRRRLGLGLLLLLTQLIEPKLRSSHVSWVSNVLVRRVGRDECSEIVSRRRGRAAQMFLYCGEFVIEDCWCGR
jgi:hypothetical protein